MGYEVPQTITVTQGVTCGGGSFYTGAVSPAERVKFQGTLFVPANSGGIAMGSGDIVGITIKALAKNSGDLYIGGDTSVPYSGYGYCLEPGESWNLDIQNLNKVWLVSVISGDAVSWGAVK